LHCWVTPKTHWWRARCNNISSGGTRKAVAWGVIAMQGQAIVFTIISVLGASTVCAEESPQQVFNNMANETAECAAYFDVVSVAMENSKKPDQAQ
jgi:hypothetical protein